MRRRIAAARTGLVLALGAGAMALGAMSAFAVPKAKLWPRWTAHDPASTATIDHGAWQRFLERYVVVGVDGINRVAYRRVNAADRRALAAYIDALAATPVSRHNRDAQRAFWINLYNALTVRLVLQHYPLESLLDLNISPGWFSVGPWGRKLVAVEGERLSLDDIEHRILRPIWRDPRIHYAVNCAAVGCPNLQATAFTGANAERLLDGAARAYVNNWRGAMFDGNELYVSSIYKWYRADFGGSVRGVLDHLRRYAAPVLARRLGTVRRIDGYQYDWALNEASSP